MKSIQGRPILLECMGAERREGTLRRLDWWHLILDYSNETEGEAAGPPKGLDSSAPPPACLLAAHTTAPSRLPGAGVPAATAVASGAAGNGRTEGSGRLLDSGGLP